MKRGRIKIKNKKKIIILVTIIILIILLLFISIKFVGQVTGEATSTALYNCTDSDNGVNYFEKGVCNDRKQRYIDACYSGKGLGEYYCGRDKYSCIIQETACPYGCLDGRCLKKGEVISNQNFTNINQINNSPADDTDITSGKSPDAESDKNSYPNTVWIIFVIVILIFLGWVLLRKRTVKVKKNSIKLKWK